MAQLPIADFIQERLKEYDPNFEVRKGSAFDKLFFKPSQFLLQPIRDEADELFIGQSLRRILAQDDPDSFNEELVDDLVSNFIVYREEGGVSSGSARVYYASPVNREYPALGFTCTGSNGLNYSNPAPYFITEEQMSAQIENGLYYFDIPIVSDDIGKDTELDTDGIVAVVGDDDVITVTNKLAIKGGTNRETNTELIERARNAITVRDLVTGKGFSATLNENFPATITEIQAIGFGDREMMRDILFNAHVGGKHDGWIKTSSITTKSADFVGLLVDSTRQTKTTTQITLEGTGDQFLGETNIDRTLGIGPQVSEVKPYTAAEYTSPVDLSSPVNLGTNQHIKITIDSTTKIIQLAGATPSTTTRNEILAAINQAFGIDVAFAEGTTVRLLSPTTGVDSKVLIENPGGVYSSALVPVFGDPSPASEWDISGDGPITFIESVHFEVNDGDGTIKRLIGAEIVSQSVGNTGEVSGVNGALPWVGQQTVSVGGDVVTLASDQLLIAAVFADPNNGDKLVVSASEAGNDGVYYVENSELVDLGGSSNYRRITVTRRFFGTEDAGSSGVQVAFPTQKVIAPSGTPFSLVEQFDIFTVVSGPYAGDYRILEVNSSTEIVIDAEFSEYVDFENNYYIRRTGIKDGELVYVEFYYNPLSIDVGKYIKLDDYGRERGIRPGRESQTITDVAFLKINSIEIIDPISREPLGEVLRGEGGYGRGGYGEGPYGVGSGSEYYLRVNEPTARFSAFEDSYIVIDSSYQGFSFRVHYDCVPEIETIHTFCRSDSERVLDGDILVKHFIPAYVSGTIPYRIDSTDTSIPNTETLTGMVKEFINSRPSGGPLEFSDISQYILSVTDPYRRYGGAVYPMELEAEIQNTDGSTFIVAGDAKLEVVEEDPFPLFTTRPLTARTMHWVAGDITLSLED